MKRYEKFVLEAEKGIIFEASEGTSGELIIRARTMKNETTNFNLSLPAVSAGEYAKVLSVYTDSAGNKAVVPQGWTVSGVPKENIIWGKDKGLVIYHIPEADVIDIDWLDPEELEKLKRTYDQLIWTPVSLLEANGTLDGEHFSEKFGRRNYMNEIFSMNKFYEELVGDLALEKESIDKYDGYYSTRYDISKDIKTGKPRSVKGAMPWMNISEPSAEKIAKTFVEDKKVSSHLMYGAEYDTREEWVKETKTMTFHEIAEDSTEWGNHRNTENSPRKVVETGSREKWCANNIYDFAGNVDEWTQEQNESSYRVIRGGYYLVSGDDYPVAYRNFNDPNCNYFGTGFRATLYIK